MAVVGLVAVGATGCGLPASDHVERIDPRSVPFGLLESASPGTPTPSGHGLATAVFFVSGGRLVAAQRRTVGGNVPASSVRLLLVGPTPAEVAAGVRTDVPSGTRMVSLDVEGPIATVDLSEEFGTVGGSDQVFAVAQIVYTLTASRFIDAVRFAIRGHPIEVPDGSGSLSAVPRTRSDYPQLAPS
jgi:spore germination protein GerM